MSNYKFIIPLQYFKYLHPTKKKNPSKNIFRFLKPTPKKGSPLATLQLGHYTHFWYRGVEVHIHSPWLEAQSWSTFNHDDDNNGGVPRPFAHLSESAHRWWGQPLRRSTTSRERAHLIAMISLRRSPARTETHPRRSRPTTTPAARIRRRFKVPCEFHDMLACAREADMTRMT